MVQAPNDKQQIEPMLNKIDALPDELGKVGKLLADTGYFSAANVAACEAAGIAPLIAMGRQPHHPPVGELFCDDPLAPENPTPVEAMAHRLKTRAGRDLYALRKQIPEPVFGIIKSVMGFRQFLLRGIDKVRGEWRLVTMAWNMKRLFALRPGLLRAGRPRRREYPAPSPIQKAQSQRPPEAGHPRAPTAAAATRKSRFEDPLQELSPTGC